MNLYKDFIYRGAAGKREPKSHSKDFSREALPLLLLLSGL